MAHAEGSIAIDRPCQHVFEFILDGTNNPLWRAGVVDIQRLSDKPDGVGSKFKQGHKGPFGRIDADYEIVGCDPNVLIQFEVTAGPARPTGTYRFEARGTSTVVTFTLDFRPKGLAILLDSLVNRQMKAEVATLSSLKAYLESHR